MGWMDKAKQLAEQAQQKLDDAQKQFNDGQPQHQSGENVSYDKHGRPQADPAVAADPSAPAMATPDPEAPREQAPQAPSAPSGDGPNATPDPFKPLQ